MHVLVTTGKTRTLMGGDVRITSHMLQMGMRIALELSAFDHVVTLVTSDPSSVPNHHRMHIVPYRSYHELSQIMEKEVGSGLYNAVIHAAVVSDYQPSGRVFTYSAQDAVAHTDGSITIKPIVMSGQKLPEGHEVLYAEMIETDRLIDQIRTDWNFRGFLGKSKIVSHKSEAELVSLARISRERSDANFIFAYDLARTDQSAFVIGSDTRASMISFSKIPEMVLHELSKQKSGH